MVGRTTLDVLLEWRVPLTSLRLFGSTTGLARELPFNGRKLAVEPLAAVPDDLDAVIFATSADICREWIPRFRERGVIVIDHSSQFRLDPSVPLVIPEINSDTVRMHHGLISNPNCTASVALLPLAALDNRFGLERVIAATYQSVSGAGADGLQELERQLSGDQSAPRVHSRTIAHNVIPQVGPIDEKGSCEEETKFVAEVRKILKRPDLPVMATTVRVPVRVGHSMVMSVRLKSAPARHEVQEAFRRMHGMIYDEGEYRTPVEIAGRQEIFVSRLRVDPADGHWWQFWAVGDNLRKGAASNAVQILQALFSE